MATTKRKTKKPARRKAVRKSPVKKTAARPRRVVKKATARLEVKVRTAYTIGEQIPSQGGTFAGAFRGADGKEYGLVVAPGAEGLLRGAWGEYGKEIKGANSRIDGRANTEAMSAAGSKLAKDAIAKLIGGKGGWYIPSQRELMLCFVNVPDLFDKNYHWSSTQSSANYAWVQTFEYGYVLIYFKDDATRCRLVRSFPL